MSRPSISQGTRFLVSLLLVGLLSFRAFADLPPEATAEDLLQAALEAKDAGYREKAFELYERAAALGNPTAKRALSINLRFGGDEADKARARALLLETAESDYVPGMVDFANMAARGQGGPVDGPAAVHWATRAFEKFNENSAISLLGVIYEEGLGVPRDLKKALAWYERGKAAGYAPSATDAERLRAAARMTAEEKLAAFQAALDAVRHTGSYHRDRGRAFWNYVRSLHDGGLTVEETTAAATPGLQWLMEKDFHALAFGVAATGQRFRPGIEAQLTAQQREVIEQIRKSYADRRAPQPPIAQGQGWSEVFGPPPSSPIPANALASAPSDENAFHAQAIAARTEKNLEEARRLFARAADAGHVPSMIELGKMIAQGQGGDRDAERALQLFIEAADTGDPEANFFLAKLHDRPQVGSWQVTGAYDPEASLARFEKAALAGHAGAMMALGYRFQDGVRGAPRDLKKALEWYRQAMTAGSEGASEQYQQLSMNLRLSPEEKIARYRKAWAAAARSSDPSRARGLAFSQFAQDVYDGGLSLEETQNVIKPELQTLIESDFYALDFARTGTRNSLVNKIVDDALTGDQLAMLALVRPYRSKQFNAVNPGIEAGQGWSQAFGDERPPVLVRAEVAAAKPRPAPPVPQLTEFTRDATNWEEFFIGSARRNNPFFLRHSSDVKVFRTRNAASPEQLREAYRRAHAAFTPTPGTDLGKERGAMFVAYTVALEATGMTPAETVSFAGADFRALGLADLHGAYQALMGVEHSVDPWRALLNGFQRTRLQEIAKITTNRQPFPKVPDPWVEFANRDPIGAAKELYTKLYADLAARDKGVTLLPEEQKALDQLAGILPQANERDRAALDRQIREFVNKEPGANDLSAGNQAFKEGRLDEAFRLFEKAAGAGSSGAKVNLAVQNYGEAHTLPFERRIALLEEAHAAGMPGVAQLIAAVHLEAEEPNLDEALRWARASLEAGYRSSAKHLYSALRLQRRAIEQDPMKALAESNKPEVRQARETEMNEAVERLRDVALLGDINAMYDLAIFHFLGQPPGLRSTFRFNRPEHNLHLARFWFQQVLNLGKNLSESASSNIPRWIDEIDATLALVKGREWTADEVIAALDGGTSQSHLSWLLAREGGTFSKREHTRILTSEGGKKIGDYSDLGMQLGLMVVTGPDREARDLAAAAIAARRETVQPLPFLGDDVEALRQGYEAGDPAAAYALLRLLPPRHFGGWPEDAPPRDQVRAVALSQDYGPAQYLRVDLDKLVRSQNPLELDLPRAFALLLASAQAGSAEAARNVADFYRGQSQTPVRPNLVEAEWWYAQAAALAWPRQFESTGGILEPERNLAHLYMLESASLGGGIGLNARDPAVHRWLRELRARGGVAREIAEERIAYYGTSDAGRLNLEGFIAALPPAMPLMSEDERAQLERAAAGKTEARLKLARALAFGEGGFRQDDARAVALYQQAAEAGSTEAMTALIEQLRGGFGVKRDYLAALAWQDRAEGKTRDRVDQFIEAARQASFEPRANYLIAPYLREAIALGSVEAKSTLGSHLMTGRVVKKDVEEGIRLLTEAAEAGNVRAMTSLSFHYREGKEVPQDLAAAHLWRVRAAEAGDKNSIHALVGDFDRGENGAPVDAREALRFARLSEAKWIRDSIIGRERDVATLDRNPGMTTEELRKAKVRDQMQFYDIAMAATAAATGETDYIRAAGLQGEARLAALREAARKGYIKATRELIDDLTSTGNLHEAHWWAGRDWQLENGDTELEAKVLRDNLERRADFNVLGLKTEESGFGGKVLEGFTTARDQSLESSMPELAEALANAGGNPRRLVAEVERIRDRLPDRAESHIALAQLSMDQPDFARILLEKAIELDRTHPQAHVLLARIEASSGQPYRAYYRLLELAQARPNSVQVATARAELLHALGGSKKERTDLRSGLRRLLEEATPPERFNGYVAAAKLAAGMDDLENALIDLSAAIAISPVPGLRLERAQLHEQLKNYPQALADYMAVLNAPGGLNPQQKTQLNARIEQVQKAMTAETTRLQGEVERMDGLIAQIDEFRSEENQQRMKDEIGSMMDGVFRYLDGNKAYEAGDIEKAREYWTQAAAAGHEEAAQRLKNLPPRTK